MSDICERLVRFAGKVCISTDTEVEAAATIEALRAENARLLADIADWKIEAVTFGADTVPALRAENAKLREALKPIIPDKVLDEEEYSLVWNFHLNAARKAMGESDE